MLQIKEMVRCHNGEAYRGSVMICNRKMGGMIIGWTLLISNKVLRLCFIIILIERLICTFLNFILWCGFKIRINYEGYFDKDFLLK